MNPRSIFPGIMFVLAAMSFAFGIWQYVYAIAVQATAGARMAYIMTTIDHSSVASSKKQELYASIMDGLPKAPSKFGIDVSGSFASQGPVDACVSDGQRAVCRALISEKTNATTVSNICGVCNPK